MEKEIHETLRDSAATDLPLESSSKSIPIVLPDFDEDWQFVTTRYTNYQADYSENSERISQYYPENFDISERSSNVSLKEIDSRNENKRAFLNDKKDITQFDCLSQVSLHENDAYSCENESNLEGYVTNKRGNFAQRENLYQTRLKNETDCDNSEDGFYEIDSNATDDYVSVKNLKQITDPLQYDRIKAGRTFMKLTLNAAEGIVYSHFGLSLCFQPNTSIDPVSDGVLLGVTLNPFDQPNLSPGQTLLSPVIICLPHAVTLSPQVVLKCSLNKRPSLSLGKRLKLLHSATDLNEPTDWKEASETVCWNVNEDKLTIYLQQFCLYCLVEENIDLCKQLRLSVYGRIKRVLEKPLVDLTISVSSSTVEEVSPPLGDIKILRQTFPIKLNHNNMNINVNPHHNWILKYSERSTQEIMYDELISSTFPIDCKFCLQGMTDRFQDFVVDLTVSQEHGHSKTFSIEENIDIFDSNKFNRPGEYKGLPVEQQEVNTITPESGAVHQAIPQATQQEVTHAAPQAVYQAVPQAVHQATPQATPQVAPLPVPQAELQAVPQAELQVVPQVVEQVVAQEAPHAAQPGPQPQHHFTYTQSLTTCVSYDRNCVAGADLTPTSTGDQVLPINCYSQAVSFPLTTRPIINTLKAITPSTKWKPWPISFEILEVVSCHLDLYERWKMLASKLEMSGSIPYIQCQAWQQKTSPTVILFQESFAQNNKPSLDDLTGILAKMKRQDIIDDINDIIHSADYVPMAIGM